MSGSVIVLGANGRFGRAAVIAFAARGWKVTALNRTGADLRGAHAAIACDAFDHDALIAAAKGHDVIVNALHPPYERWAIDLPRLTQNVLAAAKSAGATVIVPGNVYNYGRELPPILTEDTPHVPNTKKSALRIEMERTYEAQSHEVQTIIVRGGDFIEREKTGNWFDSHIADRARDGRIAYPGPLDQFHAWAYLPDMARAAAMLAEKRTELAPFSEFGFEGFTLTGNELVAAVERATGKRQKVSAFPWLAVKVLAILSPKMHEVLEMRYLWDRPHQIDGSKLRAAIPDFVPTKLDDAMAYVFA